MHTRCLDYARCLSVGMNCCTEYNIPERMLTNDNERIDSRMLSKDVWSVKNAEIVVEPKIGAKYFRWQERCSVNEGASKDPSNKDTIRH